MTSSSSTHRMRATGSFTSTRFRVLDSRVKSSRRLSASASSRSERSLLTALEISRTTRATYRKPASVRRSLAWRAALAPYYREFGIDADKVPAGPGRVPFSAETADLLEPFRPPVVSFHFGLPSPELVARVRQAGKPLIVVILAGNPAGAYSAGAVGLYTAGSTLMEAGDYSAAATEFDQAVSLEPGYFEAWNALADALNRAGQFNDALAASNRSLNINPDYVDGWVNRGQILYNIGYWYEDIAHNTAAADSLYAEQLTAFEKAVALEPGNAEAWFNKGYALAGMKRYDEAIAAFDQVGVIDPSYPNLEKNREIAVFLRNKAGAAGVTTGSTVRPAALATTVPESPGQQPAATSPRPSRT